MRHSYAVVALVAAAFLVTGCAGGTSAPATATVTTTVTPPPATKSATPTPTPTATSGAQVDPNAPAGQCADSALSVAVTTAAGGAGAGSQMLSVDFTNTGGSSCELRGDPGVSVVGGGNGTQLGSPAKQEDSASVSTVTVAPGQTVSAPLKLVNIGTDGGPLAGNCTVAPADGYRVYPPHSFTAFFVASAGLHACSNTVDWMTVGAVAAK